MQDIKKWKILWGIVLCLGVYPLCLYASQGQGGQGDYILGPGDVIEITVYEEPELTRVVRISANGTITFPLVGQVEANNCTVSQLELKLARILGEDYLVNPQVSVYVKSYESKQVLVLGAVNKPGAYPLSAKATVLEMLSRAEGVELKQGGKSLILLRKGKSNTGEVGGGDPQEIITMDLNKLLVEGDTKYNIYVQNGDIIHVPKSDSVFVFGQVKNPGSYTLEKEVTVLQAITMAGGVTRIANPSKVKIIRVNDGYKENIMINLNEITDGDKSKDVRLRSEDIVVVPESFF